MIRKVNDNRSIVLVADKKLINVRHHMQTCGINSGPFRGGGGKRGNLPRAPGLRGPSKI